MRLKFKEDTVSLPQRAAPTAPWCGYVTATAKCGHQVTKTVIEKKHGTAAIDNIAKKNCKACNLEAQERQRVEAREKRERIRIEKRALRKSLEEKTRLPNGSRFEAVFDADAVLWHGRLVVGDLEFEARRSAVFKLMRALDGLYRDHIGMDHLEGNARFEDTNVTKGEPT